MDYEIREMRPDTASGFVKKHHYSPLMPKITKHWLGLYRDGALVGVFTLGWGTRPLHTIKKIVNADMSTDSYLEIGKMCLHQSEPRNSESRALSLLVKWLKKNIPDLLFLYTLADGMMGKCGYVYQASNFYYGGSYWTDSYIASDGRKIHPRTDIELHRENWLWHHSEDSVGYSEAFRDNHSKKVLEYLSGSAEEPPEERVYWLTPEFQRFKSIRRIRGKMFRYIYPLSKSARRLLSQSEVQWRLDNYPKDQDLEWKIMVRDGVYASVSSMPAWYLG